MEPTFFADQHQFRKWLIKNYKKETELLVGFYKTSSGKPSMTWPESVDQALCFGWIDAVRRSRDEESYTIRFTRRKPDSIWSSVNIAKMEKLIAAGLVMPEGLEAYSKRKAHKTAIYSYEKEPTPLAKKYEDIFKKNKKAWTFFNAQAPSYIKQMIHRIMDAKQEKTQLSRLEKIIAESEAGRRVP